MLLRKALDARLQLNALHIHDSIQRAGEGRHGRDDLAPARAEDFSGFVDRISEGGGARRRARGGEGGEGGGNALSVVRGLAVDWASGGELGRYAALEEVTEGGGVGGAVGAIGGAGGSEEGGAADGRGGEGREAEVDCRAVEEACEKARVGPNTGGGEGQEGVEGGGRAQEVSCHGVEGRVGGEGGGREAVGVQGFGYRFRRHFGAGDGVKAGSDVLQVRVEVAG